MSSDKFEDWKKLPDDVDFLKGSWSYGRGGRGLEDWQFNISFIDDDLSETIYVLPDCLSRIIRREYQAGQEDIRENFRQVLGL